MWSHLWHYIIGSNNTTPSFSCFLTLLKLRNGLFWSKVTALSQNMLMAYYCRVSCSLCTHFRKCQLSPSSVRKPGLRAWVGMFHLAKFNISTSLFLIFMLKISVKTGQPGVSSVCKPFGCCYIYAKIFVFYRISGIIKTRLLSSSPKLKFFNLWLR